MAKAKKAKKTTGARGRSLRAVFIGAGNRAKQAHYPSLDEMANVEIAAVSELNDQRMADVADQFGIAGRYTNFVEMIEKERPDVVYAIMPPHHMFDVVMTIIEMGCNIVIEKPPGLTAEQVRMMSAAAKKHKVITGVTFQRRFAPVIRTGKEICEKAGPIHTAEAQFVKSAIGGGPIYRGAIDLLTCDGIHAVDTLRYLCGGEVESVASDVRRLGGEHQTVFLALVRFSSGATGFLKFGYQMGRRIFSVEAHAPGVSLYGDPEEGGRIYANNGLEPTHTLDPVAMAGSDLHHRAFGAHDMNLHFMDCIRKGRQPETNLDDALKTMELVKAVHGSQI